MFVFGVWGVHMPQYMYRGHFVGPLLSTFHGAEIKLKSSACGFVCWVITPTPQNCSFDSLIVCKDFNFLLVSVTIGVLGAIDCPVLVCVALSWWCD